MKSVKHTLGIYPAFTGWLPPVPDTRDYSFANEEIVKISAKLGLSGESLQTLNSADGQNSDESFGLPPLPNPVDLRGYCSPIENQGALGSCTANAGVGIVEYFEKRAFNKHIDGSRLFVYKATRNLLGWTGDTGAFIRTTMAALALCGCPPEKYWPYTDSDPDFDIEPTSFVYALADNYEALRYFCHDPLHLHTNPKKTLYSVKRYLSRGIPSMFGFYGYEDGYWDNGKYYMPYHNGEIYAPCPGDFRRWGHAIVAVGYDDTKVIKNPNCNVKTKGALLIRNSWGTDWGENGYGWLPYKFVLDEDALDFWSLLNMKWVDTGNFGV